MEPGDPYEQGTERDPKIFSGVRGGSSAEASRGNHSEFWNADGFREVEELAVSRSDKSHNGSARAERNLDTAMRGKSSFNGGLPRSLEVNGDTDYANGEPFSQVVDEILRENLGHDNFEKRSDYSRDEALQSPTALRMARQENSVTRDSSITHEIEEDTRSNVEVKSTAMYSSPGKLSRSSLGSARGEEHKARQTKQITTQLVTTTDNLGQEEQHELDEELEEILGRVQACAELSKSLMSEQTEHPDVAEQDVHGLLRRSLDVSMELQMVAARFSAMWGSQLRRHAETPTGAQHRKESHLSRMNLGRATKAVQKCFEAEREGLLREIRALEARNRKFGMTIRGLETRKEREEHLGKRCRLLQDKLDDTRARAEHMKLQFSRSQSLLEDSDRMRRILEDEVVQLRKDKDELMAKLETDAHEAARALREQTRELSLNLEAEREAHAAMREAWHQAKLDTELIKRQIQVKDSALRDKEKMIVDNEDVLRHTAGSLRAKLKHAENRAFQAEDSIAGARAEADAVRVELTEQLNDARAKLSRTEALRQEAVLEIRDLREQMAKRHQRSEDTDSLSLQRQVTRLCEANNVLREDRERAEKTAERALAALRQARLLENVISDLRTELHDRDETIHQLTLHYRSAEQEEVMASQKYPQLVDAEQQEKTESWIGRISDEESYHHHHHLHRHRQQQQQPQQHQQHQQPQQHQRHQQPQQHQQHQHQQQHQQEGHISNEDTMLSFVTALPRPSTSCSALTFSSSEDENE